MPKTRRTVSMTQQLYRWLAWASAETGKSMCSIVATAIAEKLQRDGVGHPPEDWEPVPKPGRKRRFLHEDMAGGNIFF